MDRFSANRSSTIMRSLGTPDRYASMRFRCQKRENKNSHPCISHTASGSASIMPSITAMLDCRSDLASVKGTCISLKVIVTR